jgi:hypothetical protein
VKPVNKVGLAIVGAVMLIAGVIGWAILLTAVFGFLQRSTHDNYSLAEQEFLAEINGTPGDCPGDAELVREGHQICRLLDANGGDRAALYDGYGPSPMPRFLTGDQRFELVNASTKAFCNRYTPFDLR